jgi:DNA invertase Pin-like site-specific DNA recombinase
VRAAGFNIDEVVADNGVSGLNTRLTARAEGHRLYDKLRAGDTLVVRWVVDRLGRNYEDVCDTIRHFMRRGERDAAGRLTLTDQGARRLRRRNVSRGC